MYERDSYVFEGAFPVKVLVTDVPAPEHLILFFNYGNLYERALISTLFFRSWCIPLMPICEASDWSLIDSTIAFCL